MEGARIGKNCRIFPGSVISAIPQDLKYDDEETTVLIGDNVTIRECVTINRGTSDRMKTVIGNNCLIMAYCHIAHDCFVGDGCIISNNSTLAGHVTIGHNVVLAGMVAVHQF
jgi:UDP-N-acetylglucosamine acyltransferase